MRKDIVDGMFEFHVLEDGTVTIAERDPQADRPEIVVIPREVWRRNWSQLVSVADMREVSNGQFP